MLRAAAIVLLFSSPVAALAQGLTMHGSFRHMMHSGDASGAVALDTLDAPRAWGVGATVGMRGEVVIIEGRVLVSRGADPEARITSPEAGEQAAILAYGEVEAWREVALPHDMTPEQLTIFLEHRGAALGLDLAAGFPLRIRGAFPTLVWHVVTGDAPAQGRWHGGAQSRDGGSGGRHANIFAGMTVHDEPGAQGELVGVYTGAALEGIASHPGERLHLHVVTAEGARSGHVDEVIMPAGARLMIPVAGTAAPHATHAAPVNPAAAPQEAGQSAFAAIHEIVALLMADPSTDWSRVDVEALRRHLIDMDNVTLRAQVEAQLVDGGARFLATSADEAVVASIRAMVPAHARAMNGANGWRMTPEEIPAGAALTVTGGDVARIRGLGFIGVMTVGMHHQAHHLAIGEGAASHHH